MFRRITTLLGVAATATALAGPLALVAPAGAQAAVTVTVRSASLVVPCGTGTTTGSTTADWFVPSVAPSGVVWVQHGFSRNRSNVRDLATRIARDTRSIVVAPDAGPCGGINGSGFHQGIARLFGDRQALLQTSYAAAAAGLAGAPATLPEAYVLTGHSAGGNAATAAAGYAVDVAGADLASLRGVVLFDPVENGGAMTAALAKLPASVPVATISAPNSSCNASSSGTNALRAARSGFVGFRLARGVHTDAEGPSGTFLGNLVCGFPRSENVAALRTLATGWIGDQLAGRFGSGAGLYAPPGTVVSVGAASATSL